MQQFLERHAHVRMRQQALSNLEREFGDEAYGLDMEQEEDIDSQYHAVPHNVIEQLHMWEAEENRLNEQPAALFRDCFNNEVEFNRTLAYCQASSRCCDSLCGSFSIVNLCLCAIF